MKRAELRISDELLRHILAIPESVRVVCVSWDQQNGTYSMILAGDGLPDRCDVPECEAAPLLKPTYHKDNEADIASSVCWK